MCSDFHAVPPSTFCQKSWLVTAIAKKITSAAAPKSWKGAEAPVNAASFVSSDSIFETLP